MISLWFADSARIASYSAVSGRQCVHKHSLCQKIPHQAATLSGRTAAPVGQRVWKRPRSITPAGWGKVPGTMKTFGSTLALRTPLGSAGTGGAAGQFGRRCRPIDRWSKNRLAKDVEKGDV